MLLVHSYGPLCICSAQCCTALVLKLAVDRAWSEDARCCTALMLVLAVDRAWSEDIELALEGEIETACT